MVLALVVLALAPDSTSAAAKARSALLSQHGEAQRTRIERGVSQVAALWRPTDGDLVGFCTQHFVAAPEVLEATFHRFEHNFEQLDGHLLEIGRELRRPVDVDDGPVLPVDETFAAFEPAAHLTDDFFANRLAFVALLNFRATTLEQRSAEGERWSRREWAEARLTGRFSRRVPAAVQQGIAEAQAAATRYVDTYNLWMHHVLSEKGERLFPSGKRLISHWNLRDELKAAYADPRGLEKQRTIVRVMERIVTQAIPAAVIDNPRLDWNPWTNEFVVAPPDTVERDAPQGLATPSSAREADVRYATLLRQFATQRAADPYSPSAPTAMARAFALTAEMPEARVRALLEEVLTSASVPKVAAEMQRRLGRPLEPTDLWFNGFVARGAHSEETLDTRTRTAYPTSAAFEADVPRLLGKLGFSAERAAWLASHIRVDASRGAGHAMPASRRGDFPRLRTRVEKGGMNFKGFNIAVHELGHNVEQVVSLYDVDSTLLAGVPNNAFTEAMAFVFQARDIELLGLGAADAEAERQRVLSDFWATFEIAGVALVDIDVWRWMYAHPKATPAQLREATVQIAEATWARYYAPVLGKSATPLLGIYSHMLSYPLYLFNYPLGHLIAFQLEAQVAKSGSPGPTLERMARLGAIGPDAWMTQATGGPVSAQPLLTATEQALAPRP